MFWFRFSLKKLLALVAALAISTSALVYASQGWRAIIFSLLVCSTIAAVIAAIFASGSSRAFAAGFLIASGLYVLLNAASEPLLRTEKDLLPKTISYAMLPLIVREEPSDPEVVVGPYGPMQVMSSQYPSLLDFDAVVNSLIVWWIGLAGALFAQCLRETTHSTKPHGEEQTQSPKH